MGFLKKYSIAIVVAFVASSILLVSWQSSVQADDFEERTPSRSIFDFMGSAVHMTVGQDGEDGHGHGHIPQNGRFTSRQGGVTIWPPQFKNIENVEWDEEPENARAALQSASNIYEQIALRDAQVQNHLGERYTFINAAPQREKWEKEASGHLVTFFSYSNNITVEVLLEQYAIVEVETFAAADKQPPLRKNEVEAAIQIARKYWQDKGVERVNELQGFTIQTFRTEGDGGFYDTRMAYVSFHEDEISLPELLTWVDLTSETVYRAAIDEEGVLNEQ